MSRGPGQKGSGSSGRPPLSVIPGGDQPLDAEKTPLGLPHSSEAEKQVLGGVIVHPQVLQKVLELVEPRDFYHPTHEAIFTAFLSLTELGQPITTTSVAEQMKASGTHGRLRAFGNETYFAELIEIVVTVDNIGYYAKLVAGRARQRRFIETAAKLARDGAAFTGDADNFIVQGELALQEVGREKASAVRAILRGSDVELARALLDLVRRGDQPIVCARGSFWRYEADRGLWKVVEKDELIRAIATLDGLVFGDKKKQLNLRANRFEGAIKVGESLATQRLFFEGEQNGGTAPAGLCFTNGFVRITRDGITLVKHGPDNRCTIGLPYSYDPEARAPRWTAFLEQVFRGDNDAAVKIQVLQEFAGACLIGRAAGYAKALILTGKGRNGKGTTLKILRSLFPAGTVVTFAPADFAGSQSDRVKAAMQGALLNYCPDLPSTALLDTGVLKSVIAGDELSGKHAYGHRFVQFVPIAGHMIATSDLPATNDMSPGFWDRFIIIHFGHFIPPAERDPNLAAKIAEEERPGIAAWALDGALQLHVRNYYVEPDSSVERLDRWRSDCDSVLSFFGDQCVINHDARFSASQLFALYRKYADENNLRPVSSKTFKSRLEGIGVLSVKHNGLPTYGVELVS